MLLCFDLFFISVILLLFALHSWSTPLFTYIDISLLPKSERATVDKAHIWH